jgi:Fic family protein
VIPSAIAAPRPGGREQHQCAPTCDPTGIRAKPHRSRRPPDIHAAIHPFADGNGRVGRCLIIVVLRRGGGTDDVPSISGVCVSDTAGYFASLRRLQQAADPWPWVSQFCNATSVASATAHELSDDIVDLQARWMDQAGHPRSGSIANRLIAVLPTVSFTDADVVAERLKVGANVDRRGLNRLERAGILSNIAGRKRNRVRRADEFHSLLERYSTGFRSPDVDQ